MNSLLRGKCYSPQDNWPDHIIFLDYLDPSEPYTGTSDNARHLVLLPHKQTNTPKYAVDERADTT